MQSEMIPYAGFDPTEATIEHLQRPRARFSVGYIRAKRKRRERRQRSAPLEPTTTKRLQLDGEACTILHEIGFSYRIIGILMAQLFGRPIMFNAQTIYQVVYRYKKAHHVK